MIKINLKKLKKFLGTKAGFNVMFFVVLPIFALSATAGAVYFNNLSKPIPTSSGSGGIVPITTTPTSQTTGLTNTTAKQNTQSMGGTSGSSTYKPYVASVCTSTVIPYKTVYKDSAGLYVGETKEGTGYNGYTRTCTKDSNGNKVMPDYTSEPIDKTIYVGTLARPPATPAYTYEQALYIAQHTGACMTIAQASGTGSSAYTSCISTVLRDYGY